MFFQGMLGWGNLCTIITYVLVIVMFAVNVFEDNLFLVVGVVIAGKTKPRSLSLKIPTQCINLLLCFKFVLKI